MRLFPYVILGFMVVCGCSKAEQHNTGVGATAPALGRDNSLGPPRLWEDEAVAALVKAAYAKDEESFHVLRWNHGDVRLYVELAENAGSEPVMHEIVLGVNNLPADYDGWTIEDCAGVLFVQMRAMKGRPEEVFEVRCEGVLQVASTDGQSVNRQRTHRLNLPRGTLVRVPADYTPGDLWSVSGGTSIGNYHDFQLMKWKNGEEAPWLKLELNELGSTPSRSGEPSHATEPAVGSVLRSTATAPAR